MSRWIDADAIKNKAWKAESEACFYALEDVVSVTDIDEAPSIDIIRCGECKWFDSKGHCMRLTAEYGTYEDVRTDDFCSYGNSSEKPNNCEDLQDWKDRMWAEAIVTEPTISKMEQVGKE